MFGLQKDWTKLAHHLGYTHDETTSITQLYPAVSKQIEMFLRVFRMPNLGDDTESTLLNAIELVRPRCNAGIIASIAYFSMHVFTYHFFLLCSGFDRFDNSGILYT